MLHICTNRTIEGIFKKPKPSIKAV